MMQRMFTVHGSKNTCWIKFILAYKWSEMFCKKFVATGEAEVLTSKGTGPELLAKETGDHNIVQFRSVSEQLHTIHCHNCAVCMQSQD